MPDFPLSQTRRTLPIALLRAREAVMERFRPMLRAIDVTEAQWRVLRVVQEIPGIEPTRLAEQAVILAPSLTRILKTLESRGLVTVERAAEDRRRTQVRLAPGGDRLLREASRESATIYATIERELGAEDLAALIDKLDVLLTRLNGPGDAADG